MSKKTESKEAQEPSKYDKMMEDCKILYKMRHASMYETCMCWGAECGEGWHYPLRQMSCSLEALNKIFYKKWRVRVQADQLKEKYGTLHFYYTVLIDPPAVLEAPKKLFSSLSKLITKNVKFSMIKVTDVAPYKYDEVKELTEAQYEKELRGIKCSNVDYKVEDGKITKIIHLDHYGKYHYEPTKHKLLYKLSNIFKSLAWTLDASRLSEPSSEQQMAAEALEHFTEMIVRKAEKDCESHCEMCGSQIGTSWSPTCETTGWISYICKHCAEKSSHRYICNGDIYEGDKVVKTAKQHKEDMKNAEKKHKDSQKSQKAEEDKKVKEALEEVKKSKSKKGKN